MKKIITLLVFILLLSGCSSNRIKDLPKDPIEYKRGMIATEDAEEYYTTIEHDDKKYIMYSSIVTKNNSYNYAFGDCLGFVDNDTNDRIYELKGEDSSKWLISYYVNGEMEEPIVLKEVTYTEDIKIPSSVKEPVPKIEEIEEVEQ